MENVVKKMKCPCSKQQLSFGRENPYPQCPFTVSIPMSSFHNKTINLLRCWDCEVGEDNGLPWPDLPIIDRNVFTYFQICWACNNVKPIHYSCLFKDNKEKYWETIWKYLCWDCTKTTYYVKCLQCKTVLIDYESESHEPFCRWCWEDWNENENCEKIVKTNFLKMDVHLS
jgi:hypothetical protein